MLIDQSTYANRWRRVSPAAKGIFALGGFSAAFAASVPAAPFAVAALIFAAKPHRTVGHPGCANAEPPMSRAMITTTTAKDT